MRKRRDEKRRTEGVRNALRLTAPVWLAVLVVALSPPSRAEERGNRLQNGSFENGTDGWRYASPKPGKGGELVEHGVNVAGEGHETVLQITAPAYGKDGLHVWYEQEVRLMPMNTIRITMQVRSECASEEKAGADVGLYFLGDDKNWLGYRRLRPVPNDGGWMTVDETLEIPEAAMFMGVRLGRSGKGASTVQFDHVVLEVK